MEITTAVSTLSITNCPKFLKFHSPLRQFHTLVPSSLRFPVISHIRNPRFVTCCLSNEKTSSELLSISNFIFFCGLLIVFSSILGFLLLFVSTPSARKYVQENNTRHCFASHGSIHKSFFFFSGI